MEKRTFYRVGNLITHQGLWYDQKGGFTGLIHGPLSFCQHRDLRMEYDPEIVGFLSAADTLENLYVWFSREDILRLQTEGYYIYEYESCDYKWYDRFSHWIINAQTSTFIRRIVL